MTEQQIDREQLRAEAAQNAPYGMVISTGETLALLDQLDQAEAELDSWMTRAYEAEKRAWQAEKRIKAVRELLDNPIHLTGWDDPLVPAETIRRALEGLGHETSTRDHRPREARTGTGGIVRR